MKLKHGQNWLDGIPVVVERKRMRHIRLRVSSDGVVHLSLPLWQATLAEGAAFLGANWRWAVEARTKALARPSVVRRPLSPEERAAFEARLGAVHDAWCARLGEPGVTWRTRSMKSLWGSCHFHRRHVVYSVELARVADELLEYVVVHELTHLKAHGHGPDFHALMDARLPDWRLRRRRLRGKG